MNQGYFFLAKRNYGQPFEKDRYGSEADQTPAEA
jgi:hypothetical protein